MRASSALKARDGQAKRRHLYGAVDRWMSVARKRVKAAQAKHLRPRYSFDSEQDLHSEVRESHSTSRYRYKVPEWRVLAG